MRAVLCLLWSIVMAGIVSFPAQAMNITPFEGIVDFDQAQMRLSIGEGADQRVVMNVTRSSLQEYHLKVDLRHLKTQLCDVAAEVEGDLQVTGPSWNRLELAGEIRSRYTLLNYKPVRDLYLKFAVKDLQFVAEKFLLGAFSAKGAVDLLGEKKQIDAVFELLSADLEDIEAFVDDEMLLNSPPLTGIVSGDLSVSGALARPHVKGRLVLYNGRIKDFAYESIVLDFGGSYPVLRLNEGIVTQDEGMTFRVSGAVDVSDIASLGVQLRLLEMSPIASTTGLRKEWVLKRLHSEGDSTTELKYFLTGDDREDPAGVLGVQKKIDF